MVDPKLTLRLQNAVIVDDVDAVRSLLQQDADARATDEGNTLLMLSVQGEGGAVGTSIEVVRLLLDAGVDVNARNHAGQTALHLAVGSGGPPPVRLRGVGGARGGACPREPGTF